MTTKNLRSRAFASWFALRALGGLGPLGAALLVGTGCLHGVAPALPEAATPSAFTLPSTGGTLDSAAAVAGGPLVLVFYRGHW